MVTLLKIEYFNGLLSFVESQVSVPKKMEIQSSLQTYIVPAVYADAHERKVEIFFSFAVIWEPLC
jgi:hypothetical protein